MRDPMPMFGSQRAPVNPARPPTLAAWAADLEGVELHWQERQIRFAGSAGTPLQCDSVTHGEDTSALLRITMGRVLASQ